jgi:hypothetical protein
MNLKGVDHVFDFVAKSTQSGEERGEDQIDGF